MRNKSFFFPLSPCSTRNKAFPSIVQAGRPIFQLLESTALFKFCSTRNRLRLPAKNAPSKSCPPSQNHGRFENALRLSSRQPLQPFLVPSLHLCSTRNKSFPATLPACFENQRPPPEPFLSSPLFRFFCFMRNNFLLFLRHPVPRETILSRTASKAGRPIFQLLESTSPFKSCSTSYELRPPAKNAPSKSCPPSQNHGRFENALRHSSRKPFPCSPFYPSRLHLCSTRNKEKQNRQRFRRVLKARSLSLNPFLSGPLFRLFVS